MLKYCIDQWSANKENLRKELRYAYIYSWQGFAEIIVRNIFPNWSEKVTAISFGDYQGETVFIMTSKELEDKTGLFMSYMYYGSCSVCDALQSACEEEGEERLNCLMTLALHFIQKITHPYPSPWIDFYDKEATV